MAQRIPMGDEVNALSDQEVKVIENRLRRGAERQGLQLQKSRSRDPRAVDFGTYQLVDPATNAIVAHTLQSGYGLSLEEAARALRMATERDEVDAEAQRNRYTIVRNTAAQTSTYEKPTRRVCVQFDRQFRDVLGVTVEQSSETYDATLEGAQAALRGRR